MSLITAQYRLLISILVVVAILTRLVNCHDAYSIDVFKIFVKTKHLVRLWFVPVVIDVRLAL